MGKSQPPVDYDLTCWYLNARRVIELIGARNLVQEVGPIDSLSEIDGIAKSIVLGAFKDSLTTWLHKIELPTLGQLLLTRDLRPGMMFTHYDRYFFKGLSRVSDAVRKGHAHVPAAEAYAKLDTFQPGLRINFDSITST